MPVVLAFLLGFQHALSMLAGIITPPIILGSAANFSTEIQQYLVSTSLIVCGILSSVQITRFHIFKSPYYLGTGLISVVGTSFATIPVATGALAQMYNPHYAHSSSMFSYLTGMQPDFVQQTSLGTNYLVPMDTVQFWELLACVHFLKFS
jgi:xanthine/uracil permease